MYKQYSSQLSGDNEDDRILDYWTKQWSALNLDDKVNYVRVSDLWRACAKYITAKEPILEGGCGLGQWVVFLHQAGHQVVGVDVCRSALVATKQLHPEVTLMQADVRSVPLLDSSIGVYMSLGVVEHFEEGSELILREAFRVIRPDGFLVITVPVHTLVTRVAAMLRERREGKAHFFQYLFTPGELRSLLERHGFNVLAIGSMDVHYTIRCLFPTICNNATVPWRSVCGSRLLVVLVCKVIWRALNKLAPKRLCGYMQFAIATRGGSQHNG